MRRTENRILTTHAGSLPRPAALVEMLVRKSRGEEPDGASMAQLIEESTRSAIRKQLEAGIDVGNNGEQSRESFFTHVRHRMTGFGGRSERPIMRDLVEYPTYRQLMAPLFQRTMVDLLHAPKAIGEVKYRDRSEVEFECSETLRLLAEQQSKFVEPFMTAPSPGIIASAMLNEYYSNYENYVNAVASALKTEYQCIAANGFVLQIDAPDLAMERHTSYADRPLKEFLEYVETNVEATNRALEGIDAEQVRLHVCWGNYEAPHDLDVPLGEILPILYRAKAGALVLEAANPRHQHEYRCFKQCPMPEHMSLVTGVIDTKTNYVEHPETIADRLERAAMAVGDPRRIMAATDCGFETSAGLGEVVEEVVWAKLRAMREGADLASERLLRN
ncbi:MAG: cobalamin-independent methionine synthase II family protein [Candidatus Binatus sp.]|uniref:cobalamin-independent methionine synthase II family protein n=1 Tax=Candidatus Binatus sp. TaxID=2811406 RepID=UPI00271854B9|nr:cobalamin-independent methionine synthase II family protein [Candidatus Binatus sp.]MDO8431512.1 cobalamin-independent methionine synthase II family protein [Candidatus Binatus sp.]